jgi:iron complex transport system substrate-binding protein
MNVFGEAGKHSPWMTWKDLVKKNPDILLILPCGFGIHRILQEMDLLSSKPEWELLKAVHSENVFLLDGNQYFNRPGPRLLESLEILAEIFHPNLQRFGHEGTGWIRWKSLQS